MNDKTILAIVLLCGIVVISGCTINTGNNTSKNQSNASGYKDVSAAEAKQLIDTTPGIVIIDVSNKYAEGHIPGAVNYPVGNGTLDQVIPSLNKNSTYLVYCHFDSASISGAQKLVDAGFTKVYRLQGNYQAWVDAGYPTEK